MRTYSVRFKVELDLRSLGAPDEVIEEQARFLSESGVDGDPLTTVTNVRVENGVILFDAEIAVNANGPEDAIARVKTYIGFEEDASEPTPVKTHNWKATPV